MGDAFAITKKSRNILAKFLEDYSLEQLNTVPHGFKNNLIWNIGHIIVVQQRLVYNLSGLPMMISDEMCAAYKNGSKPERQVTQVEVDIMKRLLIDTIDQTERDLADAIFKNYTEFTTMTGFKLQSAQDAIAFNYYHEAIHVGIMMGISKFI